MRSGNYRPAIGEVKKRQEVNKQCFFYWLTKVLVVERFFCRYQPILIHSNQFSFHEADANGALQKSRWRISTCAVAGFDISRKLVGHFISISILLFPSGKFIVQVIAVVRSTKNGRFSLLFLDVQFGLVVNEFSDQRIMTSVFGSRVGWYLLQSFRIKIVEVFYLVIFRPGFFSSSGSGVPPPPGFMGGLRQGAI